MPSITKAEYQRLKLVEEKYIHLTRDYDVLFTNKEQMSKELDLFKRRETLYEMCATAQAEMLNKAWKEAQKWKRYYDAVRETYKIEETVEIPGCFSPMDSVKYIVKKQEEGA